MNEELENAIKILNKYDYIAIPVSKGQQSLCEKCRLDVSKCRYNSIGYACTNLRCLNEYIKEQLDLSALTAENDNENQE